MKTFPPSPASTLLPTRSNACGPAPDRETAPGHRPARLPTPVQNGWTGVGVTFPLLALLVLLAPAPGSAAGYSGTVTALQSVVEREMQQWGVAGIAVALVDDQKTIHAGGFGEAGKDSIFRVGSISKLFNAIAVMQQVEQGHLDLDAPLPGDVLPVNPFPGAPSPTLRQLLCHRSGLQRESAVGGYLDGSNPGLSATVASLRNGVLATRPNEKTRYSNIGASLAGYLVARVSGEDYVTYQQRHLLDPLGMKSSGWLHAAMPGDRLIRAHMRVADGRGGWTRKVAPVFDLGTIPAGNLFASAEDLARFASALIARDPKLAKPATLEQMWTPQLTGDHRGFGLGFLVDRFREHRSVSHSGAVFGHSTSLVVLPEARIAVVVLGNEDICNGPIRTISDAALSLMLEAKLGEAPPAAPGPLTLPADDLGDFAGDSESGSYWAAIRVEQGKLTGEMAGQPLVLAREGPLSFTAHSRIHTAAALQFKRETGGGRVVEFTLAGQTFGRAPAEAAPLPPAWEKYLGSYGPDFIPLVVSERHGHLYVMTENMVD